MGLLTGYNNSANKEKASGSLLLDINHINWRNIIINSTYILSTLGPPLQMIKKKKDKPRLAEFYIKIRSVKYYLNLKQPVRAVLHDNLQKQHLILKKKSG